MVEIRLATYEDIPHIMQFIDEHWKKGHIMATNRTLFEFKHVDGEEVHYVIAEDTETGEIYGTLGYIMMNHSEHPDISTMMIKARKGSGHELLGDDMSKFLWNKLSVRYVASVGMNEKYARAVQVIEDDTVAMMKQYYRLSDQDEYRIADIRTKNIVPVRKCDNCLLQPIENMEQFLEYVSIQQLKELKPYRDEGYIRHRYFEHPYYRYNVYGIINHGKKEAVFIGRENIANGAKCFRIVDFYGDDNCLKQAGHPLDVLMTKNGYEYIDFCCYGMDDYVMRAAGFSEVKDEDNIIPQYFEPFEQRNKDIYIYSNHVKEVKMFKAFGDQDRPNIMKER